MNINNQIIHLIQRVKFVQQDYEMLENKIFTKFSQTSKLFVRKYELRYFLIINLCKLFYV